MADLLVYAILLVAANYLLVLYLTDETVEGPFEIFNRIRSLAGIEPVYLNSIDDEPEIVGTKHEGQFFAKLLSCHRCTSPYTSAGLLALSLLTGLLDPSWMIVVLWLAVTGATIRLFE